MRETVEYGVYRVVQSIPGVSSLHPLQTYTAPASADKETVRAQLELFYGCPIKLAEMVKPGEAA